MIFIKEKFSMEEEGFTKSFTTICDYEEFKNTVVYNTVVNANMGLLRINTIFLYLKYRNDIGVESESYYHIVSDNEDDYKKIKKLIHSKVTISYSNEKHFNDYMSKLYPEIVKDYTYDNFCKELDSFDKVIDYNWKDFDIDQRVKLVKYVLGINCQETNESNELISNELYNEIKSKFKHRDINSQIDYEILGNIVKDGAERIYNNLNNDYDEYNKWYENYIYGLWEKEEKENYSMESINRVFEDARRRDAGILTPRVENIYANEEKRTIVIKWVDGSTTKVTCDPKDTWDIEKGIAIAVAKKALGNNYNAYSILDKYIKSVKYTESNKEEKKSTKKVKKNE